MHSSDYWQKARAHFKSHDPEFSALVEKLPDPKNTALCPPFPALCRAIIGQQLSVKAAATIWGRFERYYALALDPAQVVLTPAEEHRALGVSGQKHRYVVDLARHFVEHGEAFGEVEGLDDEEVIERWTQVVGVGRWTVQMLLISQFGRPDVFTAHDLGLRRSMERYLGLAVDGPLSDYEKRALLWSPFKTAASLWLWEGLAVQSQPK